MTGSAQPLVLVVENSPSDPVGRLAEWLRAADLRLEIVSGADLPADLAGFAGLVVLGGPMGANDDVIAPWLPHERALLRAAVSSELPTLGVCLGAQLLAAANGGRVQRNPAGPEVGAQLVAKRGAAANDPLFRPLPITPDVLQWHFDAITSLPPGAVQLASSPGAEHQAFRLGRVAWGVQFHIETTPATVRAWARGDAAELADYDLDAIVERAVRVHDDLAETWAPFAAAFAGVVRDPASANAPDAAPDDPIAAARAALAAEAGAARMPLPMPGLRHDDG
ncbi:type 1 glutamine amidotransferase [uncultured Jatrophihabitans sp.]|uniref:type 1 glutamine amidotransferase n=1 Tax=uncultured Jatrophihabitans sp. TaxID=1610747 RepID=UPI0035CA35F4